MNPASSTFRPLLLVVGKAPEFAGIAFKGWRLAFPNGRTEVADDLTMAVKISGPTKDTLFALSGASEAEVAAAISEVDRMGLPRWAVVVFGETTFPEAVSISRTDWNTGVVAHVLRLALDLHRLRRENARFRGDLSTIGTRVAHDLRSPLGGILTTAEVLKEVLAEEAPSRVPLLDPMLESADGLTKLIRQLSVLTKASAMSNPMMRFEMGATFWAAFQRVERHALSLDATIARPTVWPEVIGDPAWTEVIWHAFLANSLQHAGAKPRIEAGWDHGAKEHRFWIVDSGVVPPEKRAMLFRPFNLLHEPNAPRGFGLPIVQRLAELQGGKCGYEPVPEGGSCFFFTLPAVDNGITSELPR